MLGYASWTGLLLQEDYASGKDLRLLDGWGYKFQEFVLFCLILSRTSDALMGYLPIFRMLPKTSQCIRCHRYPFK